MTVKVFIIESEWGWGQKVDEVVEFSTRAEADAFALDYNKDNNLPYVPSVYWYAQVQD